MRKFIAILSLIGVSTLGAVAQSDNDYNENFFLSFHSTAYFDFIWSPLRMEYAPTGNIVIVDGQEVQEFREIPYQSFAYNVFSFGLEPRYNVRTLDENTAIAVSSPISIGLGQVGPPPSEVAVGSVEGFGSIQIPLYAKLYVGSGSTYESEKDYGVSLGVGLEYNKLGLIRLDNTSDPATPENKGFVVPVASLGFHFWRGMNPVEINIKYGQGRPTEYSIDRYGDPILSSNGLFTKAIGKSRSIKIGVSYLLNY
ncbi:MAG: hypothetical protein JJ975_04545 [Bacteroidia bacterium]|nr:hypothetical protein [Bacteroidia bacterium]